MKIFKLFIIIILVFVSLGRSQEALSNQRWAAEVWEALLDSLSKNIPEQEDSLGLLVLDGGRGKKFLLEGAFARHFASAGKAIALQRRGASFVVEQVEFQATYHPLTSAWLGFGRQYERRLRLHLRGWLEKNPGKTVLLTFNTHHAHTDTLSKKELDKIEQNAYPAFRGRWQAYSFWARVMEPGVVILASLAAIYLFFSMRS